VGLESEEEEEEELFGEGRVMDVMEEVLQESRSRRVSL